MVIVIVVVSPPRSGPRVAYLCRLPQFIESETGPLRKQTYNNNSVPYDVNIIYYYLCIHRHAIQIEQ